MPNRSAMLRSRIIPLAAITLVGLGLSPVAARAQAETPAKPQYRVAVIDSIQAALPLKLGVRGSVASALDALSVSMIPIEDMLPEDAACADQACYSAVAKRVGATHVLLVQGVANPAGYRLSLEVRAGEGGRTLAVENKDCELCAESQLAPTVEEKVKAVWEHVMQEEAAAAAAAHAEEQPDLEKVPVRIADTRRIPPWWQQRTPGLGLGFAGLGLVGLGFGIYYVAVDGNAVEKNIAGNGVIVRDTGKWGWALMSVGAVSLLAGGAMVIWGRDDDTQVSVAVGPNSVGLQGRF
jgi:hypothetical protein